MKCVNQEAEVHLKLEISQHDLASPKENINQRSEIHRNQARKQKSDHIDNWNTFLFKFN